MEDDLAQQVPLPDAIEDLPVLDVAPGRRPAVGQEEDGVDVPEVLLLRAALALPLALIDPEGLRESAVGVRLAGLQVGGPHQSRLGEIELAVAADRLQSLHVIEGARLVDDVGRNQLLLPALRVGREGDDPELHVGLQAFDRAGELGLDDVHPGPRRIVAPRELLALDDQVLHRSRDVDHEQERAARGVDADERRGAFDRVLLLGLGLRRAELGDLLVRGDLEAVRVLLPETLPELDAGAVGLRGQVRECLTEVDAQPALLDVEPLDQERDRLGPAHDAQRLDRGGADLPGLVREVRDGNGDGLVRLQGGERVEDRAAHRRLGVAPERCDRSGDGRVSGRGEREHGVPTYGPALVLQGLEDRLTEVTVRARAHRLEQADTHRLLLLLLEARDQPVHRRSRFEAGEDLGRSAGDVGVLVSENGHEHVDDARLLRAEEREDGLHARRRVLVLAEVLLELPDDLLVRRRYHHGVARSRRGIERDGRRGPGGREEADEREERERPGGTSRSDHDAAGRRATESRPV
ncbi:MAG: hypothetical protein AAGB93_13410 [Planctomycetota bacterium]